MKAEGKQEVEASIPWPKQDPELEWETVGVTTRGTRREQENSENKKTGEWTQPTEGQ